MRAPGGDRRRQRGRRDDPARVLGRVGPDAKHPLRAGSGLRRGSGRAAVHREHQRPLGPRIVGARQLHEHRHRRSGRHARPTARSPGTGRRRAPAPADTCGGRAASPPRVVEALARHRLERRRRRSAPLQPRGTRHRMRARDTSGPDRRADPRPAGWRRPLLRRHESAEQQPPRRSQPHHRDPPWRRSSDPSCPGCPS